MCSLLRWVGTRPRAGAAPGTTPLARSPKRGPAFARPAEPAIATTLAVAGALGLAAVLTTCSLPTDQSVHAFVKVSAPDNVLIRGKQMNIVGHLWLRRGAHDSAEIPNVELLWVTQNPRKATLAPTNQRGAIQVTGVNPGLDTLIVSAPAFQHATPAQYVLRVANALEIDSVRPTTVHYGDLLTVYGVGMAKVFLAQLHNVDVFPDTFAFAGDSIGVGQRSFWVPYPADNGKLVAFGDGEFRAGADRITVIPQDIYDPNDVAPAVIDLGAAPPFSSVPAVRFFNPALAFENLPLNGTDWFRFQVPDSTKPYTFFLDAPGLAGNDSVLMGDLVRGGTGQWSTGPGYADCKGHPFRPPHVAFGGLILPVTHVHGSTVDLAAVFTSAGRYALTVAQGYAVADSTALPDRFESSSDCLYADENFAKTSLHIDLSSDFSEVLTIDHPFEVDWLRFHLPAASDVTVSVSAPTRPAGVPSLELYLLPNPTTTGNLKVKATGGGSSSSKSLTAVVPAGDYYMVVADSAGVTTPYGICATTSISGCTPPATFATIAPHRLRAPHAATTIPWPNMWRRPAAAARRP